MSIHALTKSNIRIWISDDPEKFTIEYNMPFPGFTRVTREDGTILWLNWDNISIVGNLETVEIAT